MDIKEAARDIYPWDGTLSLSDFILAARTFSEKWKRFNPSVPPWLWVSCPKCNLVSSHEVDLFSSLLYPLSHHGSLCLASIIGFISLYLPQVEGYLSLENLCLLKSSEVC